ncbi:chitinase 8-like [Aegilops tauschii subsp. strangulata]|nr:chitinase 8-like [Aegilops tauschii subsp. strangulata]
MAMSPLAVCAAALLLALAAGGAMAQDVGSTITQAMFESMLPNRDPFYTYDAFITAAKTFPDFGTTGQLMKRELAAFFGQTSHETTGGGSQGGYKFIEEINKSDPLYYGRGPIQLTGQSNYRAAGDALNQPLESNPEIVANNPVVSFQTALWFWMTAQTPKPSCHNVILGNWTPTDADRTAGRLPGYGVITNIINGGVECGMGQMPNDPNADRIAYYKRYCDMLDTTYGDNLDCYSQKNFAA